MTQIERITQMEAHLEHATRAINQLTEALNLYGQALENYNQAFETYKNASDSLKQAQNIYQMALDTYQIAQPALKALEDYYTGHEWQQDYEADEAGQLPPDLKRGVLAQDTLWDLLARNNHLRNHLSSPTNQQQ